MDTIFAVPLLTLGFPGMLISTDTELKNFWFSFFFFVILLIIVCWVLRHYLQNKGGLTLKVILILLYIAFIVMACMTLSTCVITHIPDKPFCSVWLN